MHKIIIREINKNEIKQLENLLYEAIYQPDEKHPIPRSVLEMPEVYAYIKDFGKQPDDYCLVADLNGEIIGGVWIRILSGEVKGFGNIDSTTPEFAISLFKSYRNQGVGTKLMAAMIGHLQKNGYKQTSLSVHKENYATNLYRKMGFEIIQENDDDYLMLLKLAPNKNTEKRI